MSSESSNKKNEFYGREVELELLIEHVTQGKSVYISGARRIGKTTLMREAEKVLKEIWNKCFFHDFGGDHSPAAWICELAKKNEGLFKVIIRGLKNFDEIMTKYGTQKNQPPLSMLTEIVIDDSNWKEVGRNLFEILYESYPDGKKIVVFLDELAVMIQYMQKKQDKESRRTKAHDEVVDFMNWFSSIQRRFNERISFVIASSVRLDRLLERLNLRGTIENFEHYPLEAWKHETAKNYITEMAHKNAVDISSETAEKMLDMLGNTHIPHYVDKFFNSVYSYLRINNRISCSIKDLPEIYSEYLITGPGICATLSEIISSFEEGLPEHEYFLAMRTLSKLAQAQNEVITMQEVKEIIYEKEAKDIKDKIDEESIKNVLIILEEEGFILKDKDEDKYRFLLPHIRDCWRKRRGK